MSPPAAICGSALCPPAVSTCPSRPPLCPGAKQRRLLMPTSCSRRSMTPRTLPNEAAQNSLNKRPTDNVEWELTSNTVSTAASAATKPKSTPPPSPALKSSRRVTRVRFKRSHFTPVPFAPRRGSVLILCSATSLGNFSFP